MPPKRKHQEGQEVEDQEKTEGEEPKDEEKKESKKPKMETDSASAASSTGGTDSESWSQLLGRAAKVSAITLPPFEDCDIDRAEREYEQAFGLKERSISLPRALREVYRTFGGLNVLGNSEWQCGFNLLPISKVDSNWSVRDCRDSMKEMLEDWSKEQDDVDREEKVKAKEKEEKKAEEDEDTVRHPMWLPFAQVDQDCYYLINASSAAGAHHGQIKLFLLSDPSEDVVAADLETFWRTSVDVFIRTVIVQRKLKAAGHEVPDPTFELTSESAKSLLQDLQAKLDQLKSTQAQDD